MFNKNVPLCAFLTVCIVTFNVEAVDALNQVSNNEESHLEAFKMLADAVLNAAKIEADRIIEKAKIEAAAEIKISEANIEASQKYGLEAAKQWAPIAGVAIGLFAAIKFYSILK